MDTTNSLYGSLCRLFSVITSKEEKDETRKKKRNYPFVGTEIEYEAGQRNRIKSNAFKILFSAQVPEEETSEEHQLQGLIYKLRSAGLTDQAEAVEDAVEELERAGSLQSSIPVLKLLLNIVPLESKKTYSLKIIEAPVIHCAKNDALVLPVDCNLYPTFKQSLFDVPSVDYSKEEPYSLELREKLMSTKRLDELDVAHCRFFITNFHLLLVNIINKQLCFV